MANPQAAQNLLELQSKSYDIKFELSGSQYKPVENIGTGAYGVVCSAVNTKTNKKVAIKKIPDIFEQPTIAKRTYREIKILKHLKHDNIIAIREILKPNGAVENLRDVYIVLDLMETDLHRIIHSKQDLTDEHVRYFLYQLLRGLKYIHSANIIHRDLKPSNLLVNENCDLKIGDFGMARAVSSNPDECNFLMTQYVATRWYRAPELMMARLAYTGAVDMWSVGCIFAEMLGRKQLFPGRDFIHQLQLIIGILGTPCKDFMKLTQSDTIKKFISGWGKRKPIPFKQLYPKAQPSALGLLSRMLQINPQTRISVLDALSDPFLSKYHDPQDEPDCIPAFDFDFEKQKASIATVKQSIIKEILDYHKEPEKPKILFDFRPVPKDEIKPKPAKNSTPTSEQDSNFGLNAFLSKLREQGTQKSDSPSVKQPSGFAAFLAQQASSVDQNKRNLFKTAIGNESLSFLSTNSPPSMNHDTEDAGFKVPKGLPLSKMKSLSVSPEVVPESSQDDIEMLSAKSQIDASSSGKDEGSKIPEKWQQLSVTTANGSQGDDVEMLSAKSSKGGSLSDFKSGSSRKTGHASDGNQGKLDDGAEKAVNTKEVLKAAILNAALRKQKGEYVEKPRPMTALQKQREREDKKKKKLEKSMERKKKQKRKAKKSGGINLSDEDKNLLQRWANMQNVSKTTEVPLSTPEKTGNIPLQRNQTLQSTVNLSTEVHNTLLPDFTAQLQDIVVNQPKILPPTHTVVQNTNVVNQPKLLPTHTVVQQAIVTDQPPISQPVMNPVLQNPVDIGNSFTDSVKVYNDMTANSSAMSHMTQNISRDAAMAALPTVSSEVSDLNPPFNHLTNPLDSILDSLKSSSPNGPPTMQQSDPAHHSLARNSALSHVQQNITTDLPPSKLPPSYREAVTTQLHSTTMSADGQPYLSFSDSPLGGLMRNNLQVQDTTTTVTSDQLPAVPGTSYLPFQSYSSSELPGIGGDNAALPCVAGDHSNGVNAGQMLSVITRQMMKSHVDDLTLTKTPKGTGGGYGVGLDLEAVMSEAGKDMAQPERSAPLSATESLLGDWLEVSGMRFDAKDYEAIERELGLGSPINLSDIVSSPS